LAPPYTTIYRAVTGSWKAGPNSAQADVQRSGEQKFHRFSTTAALPNRLSVFLILFKLIYLDNL
jgi:hypothetical protein